MNFKIGKALTEQDLVEQCKQGKRHAQQEIYSRYSRKMYGVCFRYLKSDFDAEEVLVTSFTKIFQKIDKYDGNGSFEGWIRRLIVNEALMYLRKNKKFQIQIDDETHNYDGRHESFEGNLEAQDLIKLIERLPAGYNAVFNLYAIEGYSHKEIAEMMGITESTSKSQLSRARGLLQKYLTESEFFFNQKTMLH